MARPNIEAGLAEAERQMQDLDRQRAELQKLIAQAKGALGLEESLPDTAAPGRPLTLHEAMAQVLRERNNAWLTARELKSEVNDRGLYRKRDGSPVDLNQVHARTKNYEHLFEKAGSSIRLRDPASLSP